MSYIKRMMNNILIYGGSFNPVHIAHLNNIELALKTISFDKVLIVPNYVKHFNEYCLDNYEDRHEMLKLAFKEYPIGIPYEIIDYEIKSQNKIYTFDLIKKLKEEYIDTNFYFLIGSDQALKLDQWYQIEKLKEIVQFIVTKRDYEIFNDDEFIVINNNPLDYSSTLIRNDYQTTGITSVDKYIRSKGLYLEDYVSKRLSKKRYQHSSNVADYAKSLAPKYNIDENKAYIAGMLHDIGKELPLKEQYELASYQVEDFEKNDNVVHAYAAATIACDIGYCDQDIINAIKWHTSGYFEMSPLAKLIYCTDMLSYERDYPEVKQLRKILDKDLNEGFKQCFLANYVFLISKNIEVSKEYQKLKEKIERNEV